MQPCTWEVMPCLQNHGKESNTVHDRWLRNDNLPFGLLLKCPQPISDAKADDATVCRTFVHKSLLLSTILCSQYMNSDIDYGDSKAIDTNNNIRYSLVSFGIDLIFKVHVQRGKLTEASELNCTRVNNRLTLGRRISSNHSLPLRYLQWTFTGRKDKRTW